MAKSNVTLLRPIHWDNLRADEAARTIRLWAANSAKVIFSDHAWDRVDEREITREDAFQILMHGHCEDGPKKNEKGHWQVTMTRRMANRREAGAVTVILRDQEALLIRTVEWMDM
jgi:hypothetical protein